MKYNFDEAFDRRLLSGKWMGIGNDITPMTVADMDFPLLPEVGQAIKMQLTKEILVIR